jgi:hypothetical protein
MLSVKRKSTGIKRLKSSRKKKTKHLKPVLSLSTTAEQTMSKKEAKIGIVGGAGPYAGLDWGNGCWHCLQHGSCS